MEKVLVRSGFKGGIRGKAKAIAIMAMFIALSIVFGKVLKIPIGESIRISFENLPVILAGMIFGPIGGMLVGTAADLLGCFVVGYSPILLITVGAGVNGLMAGLLRMFIKKNTYPRILIITLVTHIIGSMVIKSIGLHGIGYSWQLLALRIPTYIIIGAAEAYIIYILYKKRVIM